MRTTLAALLLLGLAACGGGGEGKTDGKAKAPAVEYTDEQNAAAIAALDPPLNTADYQRGRRVFARCVSCHTVAADGRDGTGPNLHGVIGARSGGHRAGFAYSPAMKNANLTWDVATLDRYLANPNALVPGTRMAFAGIRDNEQERLDVIAYIAVQSQR